MNVFTDLFKPPTPTRKKMSEETIERLKRYRGSETARWLAEQDEQEVINRVMAGGSLPMYEAPKLEDVDKYEKDDTPVYMPPVEATYAPLAEKSVNAERQAPLKKSKQIEWIEEFFKEFVRCADQFNNTNKNPALKVNVFLPEYKFEASPYDTYVSEAKISVFKGHLSTLHWGFLVQGYGADIEIFAVPSDELLTLTLNDIRGKGFKPFLVINSVVVDNELEWQLENETVSFGKLPLLAKEIFGDLIRISAGQMNDEELFGNYSQEFKLGETVARGFSEESDAGSSKADSVIDRLSSWDQCRRLSQAIDDDLKVLAEQEESLSKSASPVLLQHMRELSADLRSLASDVATVVAKYGTSTTNS